MKLVLSGVGFHLEIFDVVDYFKIFHYHLAWWLNGTCGNTVVPYVANICCFLGKVSYSFHQKPPHPNIVWLSPMQGIIKINVNGYFFGERSKSDIEGIFGIMKAQSYYFSGNKSLWIQIFIQIEFLAI